MTRNSIALRLVIAALIWIGAALAIGEYLLTWVFRDYVENTFEDRLEDMLDDLVAGAAIDGTGQLVVRYPPSEPQFNRPYSGWYWQVTNEAGPVQRSRSLWDEVLRRRTGAVPGPATLSVVPGPSGQALWMVERYVTLPESRDVFQFAIAADSSEVKRQVSLFDKTLFGALVALAIGLVVAILIQVHYGLRPMRVLQTQVAAIRSGRSSRLSGKFPREVTTLVNELNALLDYNAAAVERARTRVGDLAHALKTPLTVISAELQSPTGPSIEVMRQEIAKVHRQIEHQLARAEAAASAKALGVRTPVMPVLEAIKRSLQRLHAERPVAISVSGDAAAAFRGQREDLEEVAGNLIENAYKWARREVRADVAVAGERIVLTIDDDGPGLAPDQRTAALVRGARLDESAPGSGLGLAIVRDIVDAYGGRFSLDTAPAGGLRAIVELPSSP